MLLQAKSAGRPLDALKAQRGYVPDMPRTRSADGQLPWNTRALSAVQKRLHECMGFTTPAHHNDAAGLHLSSTYCTAADRYIPQSISNAGGMKQRASRRTAHNLPRNQIGVQLCALLVAGLGAAAFGIADLLIGLAGALLGRFVLLSILLAFQFAMLTVGFVFTRCVVGHHLGDSVERLQTNVSAAPVMCAPRRTAPVGAV
ncbi:hypothetical protein GGR70_001833 [Xanthomonas campestris]|uniref:hypothetical protein n=1 Tax=Xanthomonas campestris TaxID=339 RepID=UPI00216983EB|nr:hypothetical protein [Xanthomonas campestris]MCS3846847.1 hypothetical protein [Xanthomonas campestris]